jgi:hypothetical protein
MEVLARQYHDAAFEAWSSKMSQLSKKYARSENAATCFAGRTDPTPTTISHNDDIISSGDKR